MDISEVDLKILWAKAAGRCSCPGCSNNCFNYFEKSGDKILGEMAHVIPQSSEGPRGTPGVKGPDTYENLILLCPYHHTMIDKAPKDFPAKLLYEWKAQHELQIEKSLAGPQFTDIKSLFTFAEKILVENYAIHQKFGTESDAADANVFVINRKSRAPVVVFLTDIYTIGMADFVDAKARIPGLNCIITVSNWNGYTKEAKEYGVQNQVGVFLVSELMGALNREEYWTYVKHDEEGRPIYHYKG